MIYAVKAAKSYQSKFLKEVFFMVKYLRVMVLAAAVMLIAQAQAFAGAQNFVLVNNTGSTIHNLYCSSVNSGDWEEDLLGATGVVSPGESVTVNFNASQRGRYWDLRLVFDNGVDIYWENIDLFNIGTITVNSDGTANFE